MILAYNKVEANDEERNEIERNGKPEDGVSCGYGRERERGRKREKLGKRRQIAAPIVIVFNCGLSYFQSRCIVIVNYRTFSV